MLDRVQCRAAKLAKGLECLANEKLREMGLLRLKKKPHGSPNGSCGEDGPQHFLKIYSKRQEAIHVVAAMEIVTGNKLKRKSL